MKSGQGAPFLALVAMASAISGRAVEQPIGNQQAFRTQTTVVTVNASVRRGNTPVAGLAAEDFIVTDNKVRQTIDTLAYEAVPIDVSLVVDMSGSTLGSHARFRSDVVDIAALLRPVDRLAVVTFGSMVLEVHDMQPASNAVSIDRMVPGGLTSVNSAVLSRLVRAPVVGRRHLVVLFTDGIDTNSAIRGETIREIARRTESVMHVVFPRFAGPAGTLVGRLPVQRAGEDVRRVLTEAAASTGGRSHEPGLFSGSLVTAFRQAFEQFRLSYVLTYRPVGVEHKGWHEIAVTVNRSGSYRVQATRGYFGG